MVFICPQKSLEYAGNEDNQVLSLFICVCFCSPENISYKYINTETYMLADTKLATLNISTYIMHFTRVNL